MSISWWGERAEKTVFNCVMERDASGILRHPPPPPTPVPKCFLSSFDLKNPECIGTTARGRQSRLTLLRQPRLETMNLDGAMPGFCRWIILFRTMKGLIFVRDLFSYVGFLALSLFFRGFEGGEITMARSVTSWKENRRGHLCYWLRESRLK